MWPFGKKYSLMEKGMFNGFTDWHSHILPGVDDGIKTMEDSLEVLDKYEEFGIKKIWLTPHIMEDFPNTPEKLSERFEELKEAYKGNIELHLAAENMLDSLFEERLEQGKLLPIGDKQNHLLVETSYFNPPYGMSDLIERTMSKGYNVLLAHPERYIYMSEKDYSKWKDRGVKFQVNYMSMIGGYGETARKKAEWLLKNNMIDVCGSDVHRLAFIEHGVGMRVKQTESLDKLVQVAQSPKLY